MRRADVIAAPTGVEKSGNSLKSWRVLLAGALVAVLAGYAAPAHAQTTVAGVTPGALSVNAMGQAGYSIPIDVPPGVAGMEPSLALNYSSGGGNGIAGMGWSISGLSAITRCGKTPAQDGAWGSVNYDADDRFCLGGKRLIGISGTYGADGTEYRTEIDSFFRIVSYGLAGTGPAWFRVWAKSGQIMDYGATADSRIEAVGRVEARAWGLDRIADTVGNYMIFSYFEDTVTGAHRVDRIDYTYNDAAAVTAQSSVQFVYEVRPDISSGYAGGALTTRDVRLAAIRTWTDSALVRDYRLAYETGAATGRSRLLSVTECDSVGIAGNCLAPTSFGWKPESAGFTSDAGYTLPAEVGSISQGAFVDLNGDGLQDFVRAFYHTSGIYRKAWLNTGDSWVESPEFLPPFNIFESRYGYGLMTMGEFVDVNRDGLRDFVRAVTIDGYPYHTTWINTGSGWQESPIHRPPLSLREYRKSVSCGCGDKDIIVTYSNNRYGDLVDINGDGQKDFVQSYKDGRSWITSATWLNTGNGWEESLAYKPPFAKWARDLVTPGGRKEGGFIDVNNDGLTDFLRAVEVQGVVYQETWLNTGNGWQENSALRAPFLIDKFNVYEPCNKEGDCKPKVYSSRHFGDFVDVNGDGLEDFVQAYKDGASRRTTWLNTSSGWLQSAPHAVPFDLTVYDLNGVRREGQFADVNGDGLVDFIRSVRWKSGTNSYSTYKTTWLNTGGTWIESIAYKPPFIAYDKYRPAGEYIDVNGDGHVDFIEDSSVGNYVRETWLANSTTPDQLLAVTDSLGSTATLSYRPLTDKAIYEKAIDAVFPVQDIQPSLHVVSEVARDDGVGGKYRTAYAYAGAKMDLAGRAVDNTRFANFGVSHYNFADVGVPETTDTFSPKPPGASGSNSTGPGFLGFQYVSATDLQTGVVTTKRRRQDFPFIGLTDFSDTYIPDASGLTTGTSIASTTRTFGSRPLNLGTNLFRYVSQSVEDRFEPAHGNDNLPITTATTTGEYDDFGNPTLATTAVTGGGQTFTSTTANTYTNDITNWFIGRLTRREATRTLPDLRSATRVSAFAWDPLNGLLAQEVVEPDIPALKLTTDYTRDVFGHVATTTFSGPDIAARTTTTEYAAAPPNYGRFSTRVTNALGHAETRTHDARFGAVVSLTGPNGITTNWLYDGFGRQILEARADGTETRRSYDLCVTQCPAGGVYAASEQGFVTVTGLSYDARRAEYYDLLDRAFSNDNDGFDGTPVYTDTIFNALGQVEKVSRAYFAGAPAIDVQWTATTYDNVGRPKTITAPDGGVTSTVFDGLTTVVTNPLNQTKTTTLDAIGQTASTTDDAGTVTSFAYDPFGNLEQTNAGGVVTAMAYDIRGRKLTMNDPDMGLWTYDYNALDELVGQTDAKLQTATLAYDQLGRMTTRTEPEGITTWTYDNPAKVAAIGKPDRVSRTEDDYVENYGYDAVGRPSETTVTYEARDYAYTATYDSAGRPATLTYPAAGDASRFAVENSYNAFGYLDMVRELGGTAAIYWQAIALDAEGRITEESLGNGLTGRRVFDAASGLVSDIRVYNGLTAIKDHGFRFDLLGNLEWREDRLGGRREDFLHDNLNRLTSATVIDTVTPAQLGQTTASYDTRGNITFKSDVGVYAYDGLAAGPHAVTRAGNVDYAYDANGNTASSSFVDTAAAHRAFAWSSFNKPTRMENAVTSGASAFVYGPTRARVKHLVLQGAAITKTTTYIGKDFERVAYPAGPDKLIHYIRAGGDRVAIFTKVDDASPATDKTRWLHKDHLGSIDMVTDEAGAIAETRSFDAWGKPRETDWMPALVDPPLTETPRGFTDHEHIQTVGLIHMNGRVQDPVLGRFISPDPSDALNPGVGFNRYAYALNNPLSLRDPDGFIVETAWDAFNVGIGIASAVSNIAAGNYLDAAIDVVGVAADLGATAVPGLPGGAGAAIKATRAAKAVAKKVDEVAETVTKKLDGVIDKNGWRTPDGKYASPQGPGRSGAAGEEVAWEAIENRPGWSVDRGPVTVRNAKGEKRVYDGTATAPDGTVYGIETKSGTARKNRRQREFDCNVSCDNPAIGVGKNKDIEVEGVIDAKVKDSGGDGGKMDVEITDPTKQ